MAVRRKGGRVGERRTDNGERIMMMPKKVKFRKQQRGRRRGLATQGQKISFGDFGLQALEAGWVTARQVEAGALFPSRPLKFGGATPTRSSPRQPARYQPFGERFELAKLQ